MPRRHRVVVLAYDRLALFEFGIVTEAFALPRPELNVPWYEFSVCSIDAKPLRATGGITVRATRGLAALQRADTIVIPGWRDADEPPPEALLAALRRANRRGARVLSICSGVFVVAAAGLLDGKRATTHWRYAERLAARFPKIRVEPDVLYIDEGRVLTSAGSAAGIDLCLHVIRKDYGKGKDDAEVVLYVIENGGHTWPGMTFSLGLLGLSTNNISANEVMWEFFRRHELK